MTTLPPAPDATLHAYRGRVLHFLHDPQYREHDAYQYWEDGLLVIGAGKVVRAGDHAALKGTLPAGAQVHDYSGKLIVPGFIDTHIHFPQTDIIASPSPGLLHWLETYTFPRSAASKARSTRQAWHRSSSMSCCATAPPAQWSGAPCIAARPRRCSSRPVRAACA